MVCYFLYILYLVSISSTSQPTKNRFFSDGSVLWSDSSTYITETSPYSFGNFRKLSLYNCFMPIELINSL